MDEVVDAFVVLDTVSSVDPRFFKSEVVEDYPVFMQQFENDLFNAVVLKDAAVAGQFEVIHFGDDAGTVMAATYPCFTGFHFVDHPVEVAYRFVFVPKGDGGAGIEDFFDPERVLAKAGVVEVEFGMEGLGETFAEL